MPSTDSAGNVISNLFVRAGFPGQSYTLPVAATTGGIAATVTDLGAIYGTPVLYLIGSTATGNVSLDGSPDGTNWTALVVANTALSANTQIITATVGAKPVRYLRANIGTQIAVAAATIVIGAF
jgi:hypothetical protein